MINGKTVGHTLVFVVSLLTSDTGFSTTQLQVVCKCALN